MPWTPPPGNRFARSAIASPGTSSSLPVRIVPCLDVRAGRVVKGVKFQGLRDQGDPAALARAYEEQGADEVVVLDVMATPEGRRTRLDTVRAVRARLSVPLTVGGGIGEVEDAAALLKAGADKVAVNTAAVRRPELLSELAARFGSQCVVISVDAAAAVIVGGARADGGRTDGEPAYGARALSCSDGSHADVRASEYEVVVRSGTERVGMDAVAWTRRAAEMGAGEVLLTSFDRDGTRSGYELGLLRAVRAAVQIPIVASGGADTPEHMADAVVAGADAVLAASIFHQGNWTVEGVKAALAGLGVAVRPAYEAEQETER